MTKKITLATFKKFVRENRSKLLVKVESSFDGMQDMVSGIKDAKFTPAENWDRAIDNSLGIRGLWLVGQSRDWFTAFENDEFIGIEYSNCCGNGIVAIKK